MHNPGMELHYADLLTKQGNVNKQSMQASVRRMEICDNLKTAPAPLDPMLSDIVHRKEPHDKYVWFDPIIAIKAVGLDIGTQPPQRCVFTPTVCTTTPKPRGRPRKPTPKPACPRKISFSPSADIQEAQATWDTAKLLGISSTSENAVLSGLRKSRRILVMRKTTT